MIRHVYLVVCVAVSRRLYLDIHWLECQCIFTPLILWQMCEMFNNQIIDHWSKFVFYHHCFFFFLIGYRHTVVIKTNSFQRSFIWLNLTDFSQNPHFNTCAASYRPSYWYYKNLSLPLEWFSNISLNCNDILYCFMTFPSFSGDVVVPAIQDLPFRIP